VEEARRQTDSQYISAGFGCRAFDLSRRDGATSSLGEENDLLPTWNEAKKNLEPAPLSP
jgi:hypothetical protein